LGTAFQKASAVPAKPCTGRNNLISTSTEKAAKTRVNKTASFDILGSERLWDPRDTLTLPRHAQQRNRQLGCDPFLA